MRECSRADGSVASTSLRRLSIARDDILTMATCEDGYGAFELSGGTVRRCSDASC